MNQYELIFRNTFNRFWRLVFAERQPLHKVCRQEPFIGALP